MATWRCRSIMIIAAIGAVIGSRFLQEWLVLASLGLAFWIGFIWLRLNIVLVRNPARQCIFVRMIDQKPRSKYSAILGHPIRISIEAQFSNVLSNIRLDIQHFLPAECQLRSGSLSLSVHPVANEKYHWEFECNSHALGRLIMPGFSVRVSDHYGLFNQIIFVPQPLELTLLPTIMKSESTVSTTKKHNVQLFVGHHRYRRAGIGTEILGIRDYQLGDPPRSIAWKASARLNKLMTCEYESEVPVRANIVCDLSSYQYLGRPGIAGADYVINAASSLANLLLSDRDPTSCCIISETGATRIRAGVGNRQLNRMVELMLTWTPPISSPLICELSHMVDFVWQNCAVRFPELLLPSVNPFIERPLLFKMFLLGNRAAVTKGKRSQLSHVFTALFDLDVGSIARLKHDDDYFLEMCQRYQVDHRFFGSLSIGVPDLASVNLCKTESANNLCRQLLELSRRASDNELFLVVGMHPTTPQQIQIVENMVKVLRGAHHRVLFVSVADQALHQPWADSLARHILHESEQFNYVKAFNDFRAKIFPYGANAVMMNSARLDQRLAAELEILKFGRHRVGK
jgi:uncharacterized protein (DUF58 family)